MPDRRKQLGDFGEQVALGYLLRQGMREEARKWRCRAGEIDLVVREGETLVFVEVRTRRDAYAVESVGLRKQARLMLLAQTYVAAHAGETTPWRIDVVAVEVGANGSVAGVEHIRHAVGEL